MMRLFPLSMAMTAMTATLAACVGSGRAAPVPAVLVAPDADDIDAVARAAETLTGASNVTLAGDALTTRSDLVLARQTPRTMEGDPAGGMILERPPRLTLMKDGEACLLVHAESGESELLSGVRCVPVKAP